MSVVWMQSPIFSNEVVEALRPKTNWNERTIKTMLNRLVKKGALGFKLQGKSYLYYPRVSQEQCVREVSRSFFQRVFRGSITPMLAHLIEEADLSKDEINHLRKLLDKKD